MLKNHFIFVLDMSGSMHPIRFDVVRALNNQFNEIRNISKAEGQQSRVSLYVFNDRVKRLMFNQPIETVSNFQQTKYTPYGCTALWDAMGQAITDVQQLPESLDPDESIVVMPLTDGENNICDRFDAESIQDLMNVAISTDRWTFAFLVPSKGVRVLQRFGIPLGNIQVWDARNGVKDYEDLTRSALNSFVKSRASGVKATRSFYKVDLSGVDASKLKQQLNDLSTEFLRLSVGDSSVINKFVEHTTGKKYVKGSGFYQLTKPEDVQEYKAIVLQDRNTNALLGGPTVRGVLGLPDYGTIRIHPGNHANYNIFIQSTSVNRKLVPGTSFLLKNTV